MTHARNNPGRSRTDAGPGAGTGARTRTGVGRRLRRAAFTLLELLVAIGASVLIALALAQLFRTTGDTVTKGRRAAYFNSYASMIQRTLSQDFAHMSRNGYLIIRHEVTNTRPGGTGAASANLPMSHSRVALERGQPAGLHRPRRIDELMFFAEGQFASSRDPVHPDWIARSGQARIYYGHGTVSDDIPTSSNFHYTKATAYSNPNVLGGRLGEPNRLNAFASNWILLRHQTLLAVPQTSATDFPTNDPVFGISPLPATSQGRARLNDKNRQISGGPASASIFRTFNRAPSPIDLAAYPAQSNWRRPGIILPASGLVDIATTDLAEIRSFVMQSHDGAAPIPEPLAPNNSPFGAVVGVISPAPQAYVPRLPNAFLDGAIGDPDEYALITNMHAWMRNGMPTNSHGDPWAGPAAAAEAPRVRIRCADFAENLPAILADTALGAPSRQMQRADMLTNERMLTASNFVPHCTEFVVEWSFGEINPATGDLRWYGSSIPQDDNDDGQPERIGYTLYDFEPNADPARASLFMDRTTGEFTTAFAGTHPIDPRLIYGQTYDDQFQAGDPRPLVAHFGFTDPTYVPASQSELQTMPWAWPTQIRVTITLTDPSDTSIERSFQFTFKTPPAGRS